MLEDAITTDPQPDALAHLHRLKHEVVYLRRCVWPMRDVVNSIMRDTGGTISDSTQIFLRDLYGHIIQIMDSIESCRDILSGLTDLYLSVISNRMNEVMKVLTIIATIFIPLTFLAGIYGMNFEMMPELHWPWAYPATLGVMAAIAGGMLVYFRRKRWL